jgi:hypothetical protein
MDLRSPVTFVGVDLVISLLGTDSVKILTNVLFLTTVVCMVALTCLELILVIVNLAMARTLLESVKS